MGGLLRPVINKLRVKEILKEKNITQKNFAFQLGMTEVGLSKSINENGNPDLKRLNEIAAALNVPVIELFEPPASGSIICPKCGTAIKLSAEPVSKE